MCKKGKYNLHPDILIKIAPLLEDSFKYCKLMLRGEEIGCEDICIKNDGSLCMNFSCRKKLKRLGTVKFDKVSIHLKYETTYPKEEKLFDVGEVSVVKLCHKKYSINFESSSGNLTKGTR